MGGGGSFGMSKERCIKKCRPCPTLKKRKSSSVPTEIRTAESMTAGEACKAMFRLLQT